jgi:hypothetical protein
LFLQLARIARPGGNYILEFASKHNLKAILRYWLGRQRWSPFALDPLEFTELNYDFHPRWILMNLQAAGFNPGRTLTVSHFRLPIIKKVVPTSLLVGADSLIQHSGNWWQLTPSVFVGSQSPQNGEISPPGAFFACPTCQTALGEVVDAQLACSNSACGHHWSVVDGLYDFKAPLPD